MPFGSRWFGAFCLSVAACWGADPAFFQKGVNFTAERGGYGSEGASLILAQLPKHGVNMIALVPYGFTPRGVPQIRFGMRMESDEGIENLSRRAHELGMKVLLKPHLWASSGFAGGIEYQDAGERAKFFVEYKRFIEHYAQLAARTRADMFCVGVELQKLTPFAKEWRDIIARVRHIYSGPLVYAATQGPEFESIEFWGALDYIGLNDYYPLPDTLSADDVIRRMEAVHRKFQRPVILTEVGFTSMEAPHREPWSENPRKVSLTDQARCYDALFRAFYTKPWIQGMYWWKIGTDGRGGPTDRSFTPWGKPAMDVIDRWYLRGK